MLVGRDLGVFSCLVLVVIFVGPVVGWVVRRKWRFAAARREEIKRLLVLASQEAARAELEAISGYGLSAGAEGVEAPAASIPPISSSPPRQFQYHCAVCFSPTTTRCAGCKAVRYCSGKCQINHWRQGHKAECRPFANNNQSNDIGGSYNLKPIKQDEYESSCDSLDTEERPSATPVEASSEESASFSSSSELPHGRHEILAQNYADEKETSTIPWFATQLVNEEYCALTLSKEADNTAGSLNDFDNCDRPESTIINPDKFEAKSANMDKISPSSDHAILVDSIERLISSRKLDQINKNCIDGDGHCGSSTSSGRSVEGFNESSFSEPSTPSSGFWEGTLDSSRSRGGALDDSVQSISSESSDGNISDFQTPAGFSVYLERISVASADIQGSTAKTVTSDNACPTTLGVSQPIGRVTSCKEMNKDVQKYMSSPSLSSELSTHNDLGTCVDPHVTKSIEVRYSSSGASNVLPVSIDGGNSKKVAQVSNSPSSSCKSINGTNGTGDTLHMLKPRAEGNFLLGASVSNFSYANGRHFNPNVELKNESPQEVSALSSLSAGHLQNTRNGLKTSMWKVVDQLKASTLSRHHSMVLGSEPAGRYNNKGLFQYDLFVKLYNWNKIELRPCGLINCGNSCYANAVLQCLAFTPPLTAYLLQGIHSKACEKKEWCFTCEFESLVLKAKDCSSALSPIKILSQIQNIGSHLSNGREEDAHEFLRYAIDKMQSICLKEAGVNASGSLEEETTLIGLTFGGFLRSKIQCMKCESKSERHEKMMDLTVEIEGDIGTLEEALRQFTGTEILDGENKYRCDRCKSYERAKKKLTILEAPNILTIALKRFQSGKFGKLNKSIYFPEILDLAPYMSGTSDKSPIYRLYGVVVHLDIKNAAFSGHYVCYVKNVQNKWFKIDDSVVKPVELESVLRKGAYMLLYARCSPRAARLVRNLKTPHDSRKLKNSTVKSRSRSSAAWDFPAFDPLNNQSNLESYNMVASHQARSNMEEDSLSDKSSFFSESGSSSTESSRDSTSTDDYFDQIFGDLGRHQNNPWRSSSDSDTPSFLSSSSLLYARHSPLADLDRYASRYGETSASQIDSAGSVIDNYGVRARVSGRSNKDKSLEGKGGDPFLYSNPVKHCRKLGNSSSSSSRGADSDRLGGVNPFDDLKSGTSFR